MPGAVKLKTRPAPRISATKLGEYLTSGAGRRRKIVEDQKHPPDFQVARYADAERAVTEFLLKGQDPATLQRWRARLEKTPAKSAFDAERRQLCIEAIAAFAECLDGLDLTDVKMSDARPANDSLIFAEVNVSVRPEVVVTNATGTQPRVGCVKIYFSKHHPLTEKGGEYVGTLLAKYAEQHLGPRGRVDEKLVLAIDVFARRIFKAPKARARRLDDITAACEEIAVRWPSV